jgi:hypothetical protein
LLSSASDRICSATPSLVIGLLLSTHRHHRARAPACLPHRALVGLQRRATPRRSQRPPALGALGCRLRSGTRQLSQRRHGAHQLLAQRNRPPSPRHRYRARAPRPARRPPRQPRRAPCPPWIGRLKDIPAGSRTRHIHRAVGELTCRPYVDAAALVGIFELFPEFWKWFAACRPDPHGVGAEEGARHHRWPERNRRASWWKYMESPFIGP